eukprot:1180330-Rhodomonas_salina.1
MPVQAVRVVTGRCARVVGASRPPVRSPARVQSAAAPESVPNPRERKHFDSLVEVRSRCEVGA